MKSLSDGIVGLSLATVLLVLGWAAVGVMAGIAYRAFRWVAGL
jgi:hypothetical protein